MLKIGDQFIIEKVFLQSITRGVSLVSNIVRSIQTGYLYHYIFIMLLGIMFLLYLCVFLCK